MGDLLSVDFSLIKIRDFTVSVPPSDCCVLPVEAEDKQHAAQYLCEYPVCVFETTNIPGLYRHLRQKHSDFRCYGALAVTNACGLCGSTFVSRSSAANQLRRTLFSGCFLANLSVYHYSHFVFHYVFLCVPLC